MIGVAIALAVATHGFRFEQSQDPITDAVSARAVVSTDAGLFAIRCDQPGPGSVYVQLVATEFLGGRGAGPGFRDVVMRLDGRAPGTGTGVYYDHTAKLVDQASEVRPISLGMTNARRAAFRLVTYDFRSIDLVFPDLTGAAAAIVRVYKACDPEALSQIAGR